MLNCILHIEWKLTAFLCCRLIVIKPCFQAFCSELGIFLLYPVCNGLFLTHNIASFYGVLWGVSKDKIFLQSSNRDFLLVNVLYNCLAVSSEYIMMCLLMMYWTVRYVFCRVHNGNSASDRGKLFFTSQERIRFLQ